MKKPFYTIFCFFLFVGVAIAGTYHVDATGGAANWAACEGADPGNTARCTVTQAEAGAVGDDIVNFYDDGGEFDSEQLTPANSGTSGHPITFQAATNETPVFDGESSISSMVSLNNRSYVTIDGLTARNYTSYAIVAYNTGGYGVSQIIQNCDLKEPAIVGVGGGVFAEQTNGLQVKDNTIDLSNNKGLGGIIVYATRTNVNHATNTVVSGNTLIGGTSSSDGINFHSSDNSPYYTITAPYHLVEDNVFSGRWGENCMDIDAPKIVIRGNTLGMAGDTSGAVNIGSVYDTNSYIRVVDNIFPSADWYGIAHLRFGTSPGPIQILRNKFYGSGRGIWFTDSTNDTNDVYIFHNTIDGTAGSFGVDGTVKFNAVSDSDLTNVNIKNNILYFKSGLYGLYFTNETVTGNAYDGNLYWNATVGSSGQDIWHYGGSRNLAYVQGTLSEEANGVESDPLFVSQVGHDYTLQSGSPAIDEGINLTEVHADDIDSGTALIVKDANWFYDGWGIAGETGDYVCIGSDVTPRLISSINYGTNTLTLASAPARSEDDFVYLATSSTRCYYGTAPDIGAFEYDLLISGASPTGTGIGIDTDLNWTNPTGAITVDVYFEEIAGACDLQIGDRISTGTLIATKEQGTMTVNASCCWRVDVIHAGGTETGTVYEFITTGGPPASPAGLATCSYNSSGMTGSYDDQGLTVGE